MNFLCTICIDEKNYFINLKILNIKGLRKRDKMDYNKMLQMVPFLNDEDLLMQIKLFDLGSGPITSIYCYLL